MSGGADTFDDRALVRPFRIGVAGVLVAFALLGVLVFAFGTGADRAEGVAERWLTDVGDTRRDGVSDRARRDAEEVGALDLASGILPSGDTEGRSAFVDLEVGKADRDGDVARVPFRLHQRVDGDAGPAVDGTIVLERASGTWQIIEVGPAIEGATVPSEGGDPAAKAPLAFFAGTLGVAVLVAVAATAVVRWAARSTAAAGY